ncbi:unnamed protein product [Adineta steineri]|uniref:G-protein coupled receptors family 1 profile domain-containing protein n=1 Tax=Adineta steineri TaxID=433720 RepID=A0A814HNW0_9BILA|nr:unnamed protein product [Adineta steineri]
MSASSQSQILYLNFVTRELNRYIPLVFLILGTIGNVLNILVFTRPTLRANPCSIYFISGSIMNFFSLYIGLITPFLALYNLDPTVMFDSLCKIRYYFRYSTITLSTWFILLACVDRYVSSSAHVHIRSWSSVRVAKRIVLIACIICFTLPYTQVFFCYVLTQKNVCTYTNSTCNLLNNIILFVCNSGLPPILMVIISLLTIRNVKQSTRLAHGARRDVQLVRILFIQVSVLVLFAIPVFAQKLYSSATMFTAKSPLTTAIDSLANQISIEISYISNSTTFYVYSITSKKYRKEVSQILLSFYRSIRRNTVQPVELPKANINELTLKTHRY